MHKILTLFLVVVLSASAWNADAQSDDNRKKGPTGVKDRLVQEVILSYQKTPRYDAKGTGENTKKSVDGKHGMDYWLLIEGIFEPMPLARTEDEASSRLKNYESRRALPTFFEKLTAEYDILFFKVDQTKATARRVIYINGKEDYFMVPQDGKPRRVASVVMPSILCRYRDLNAAEPSNGRIPDKGDEFMVLIRLINSEGLEVASGTYLPGKVPMGTKLAAIAEWGYPKTGTSVLDRQSQARMTAAIMKQFRDAQPGTMKLKLPKGHLTFDLVKEEGGVFRQGTPFERFRDPDFEQLMPLHFRDRNFSKVPEETKTTTDDSATAAKPANALARSK